MDVKLVWILYAVLLPITARAKFDSNKFERKMIALTKVLKYMIERPEQMNTDATFGVTFVQAHIQAALQNENALFLDGYQRNALANILRFAEDTAATLLTNIKSPSQVAEKLSSKMNRPEIWIKQIDWRRLNLDKELIPNPDVTTEAVEASLFEGHPQESESDACLVNLVSDCRLLPACQDLLMRDDNKTVGYPLTHKLLIIQTANALNCKTSISANFPYLSYKYCSLILQNLIDLEATDFPMVSKDLASEQIVLCGMEGFLDFLNDHYERLILDWQHPSGCYSGIRINSNWRHHRVRRGGTFTDFGCVNHATGLAAAALALFIRKDLETITESLT